MVPSRFVTPSAAPGESGPSWRSGHTGARARRFATVRVQTEVCRVCGLHCEAAGTASDQKDGQGTQVVRTPRA
jgi:hypothetical protein